MVGIPATSLAGEWISKKIVTLIRKYHANKG